MLIAWDRKGKGMTDDRAWALHSGQDRAGQDIPHPISNTRSYNTSYTCRCDVGTCMLYWASTCRLKRVTPKNRAWIGADELILHKSVTPMNHAEVSAYAVIVLVYSRALP